MALRFILLACMLMIGCDMAAFAAGSTIKVIDRASPAIGRFEDTKLAEDAIPGSIITMEGVAVIKDDNLVIKKSLARAYASFGFGFMVNHMEEAYANDDEVAGDRYRERATMAFRRAKQIVFEGMTVESDEYGGAEKAKAKGIETWKKYVKTIDDEELAEMLFWGAYAWAQYISLNQNDADALADREYANALLDHVIKLDDSVQNYAPYALRGGLQSVVPQQFGGQPQEGAKSFDYAITKSKRKILMYQVMKAKFVAVALQDRAMYKSLLQEVIDADPKIEPDQVLANKLAKGRAARYLAQIDDLFMPEEEGDAAAAAGGTVLAGSGAEVGPADAPVAAEPEPKKAEKKEKAPKAPKAPAAGAETKAKSPAATPPATPPK